MQRSSITTASSIGFLSTNLVRAGYSAAEALVGDVSGQHAQQLWLPRHAELRRAAALPRPQIRRRRRRLLLRVSLCPPRRRYWSPWQA